VDVTNLVLRAASFRLTSARSASLMLARVFSAGAVEPSDRGGRRARPISIPAAGAKAPRLAEATSARRSPTALPRMRQLLAMPAISSRTACLSSSGHSSRHRLAASSNPPERTSGKCNAPETEQPSSSTSVVVLSLVVLPVLLISTPFPSTAEPAAARPSTGEPSPVLPSTGNASMVGVGVNVDSQTHRPSESWLLVRTR